MRAVERRYAVVVVVAVSASGGSIWLWRRRRFDGHLPELFECCHDHVVVVVVVFILAAAAAIITIHADVIRTMKARRGEAASGVFAASFLDLTDAT